jgi:hypothetical protein
LIPRPTFGCELRYATGHGQGWCGFCRRSPAFRLLTARLKRLGLNNPILLKDCINFEPSPLEPKIALLRAAIVIGSLLADGIGDAILIPWRSGRRSIAAARL